MPRLTNLFNISEKEFSKLVPASLERLKIQRSHLFPEAVKVQEFNTTVFNSNKSAFTIRLSLPFQPQINLVRDSLNHPLWNPSKKLSEGDAISGEFQRFSKKFSGMGEGNFGSLAFDENAEKPVEVKVKPASKKK